MAGVWLFYQALSTGAVSIVAPISAVTAAAVPIIAGLAFQATPSTGALTGVGLAVVSIALISWMPTADGRGLAVRPRVLVLALAAGAGFGAYFAILPLAAAGNEGSPWPLMGDYCAGALLSGAILLFSRNTSRPPAKALRWAIPGGLTAGTGTALYLIAATHGTLAIVGPVASLYPAATVTLALLRDKERIQFHQGIGFVCAGTALVLVAGFG